jgi:hypothetical protein
MPNQAAGKLFQVVILRIGSRSTAHDGQKLDEGNPRPKLSSWAAAKDLRWPSVNMTNADSSPKMRAQNDGVSAAESD